MSTTNDPNDPNLRVKDDRGMQAAYLVLSEAERAKGYVRPLWHTYAHVGRPAPENPLRDLTPEEHERFDRFDYVKFEEYPDKEVAAGRFWTERALRGCGTQTTMGAAIAETYARDPHFYGGTYCAGCRDHFPVGPDGEFVWVANGVVTGIRVGT